MSDCENASSEEEDHHQTQNSETNSDFAEDQALIPGPGNASFFDISQKNLKQFPNYLYAKCLHVKVRCNLHLLGGRGYNNITEYAPCSLKLFLALCSTCT